MAMQTASSTATAAAILAASIGYMYMNTSINTFTFNTQDTYIGSSTDVVFIGELREEYASNPPI